MSRKNQQKNKHNASEWDQQFLHPTTGKAIPHSIKTPWGKLSKIPNNSNLSKSINSATQLKNNRIILKSVALTELAILHCYINPNPKVDEAGKITIEPKPHGNPSFSSKQEEKKFMEIQQKLLAQTCSKLGIFYPALVDTRGFVIARAFYKCYKAKESKKKLHLPEQLLPLLNIWRVKQDNHHASTCIGNYQSAFLLVNNKSQGLVAEDGINRLFDQHHHAFHTWALRVFNYRIVELRKNLSNSSNYPAVSAILQQRWGNPPLIAKKKKRNASSTPVSATWPAEIFTKYPSLNQTVEQYKQIPKQYQSALRSEYMKLLLEHEGWTYRLMDHGCYNMFVQLIKQIQDAKQNTKILLGNYHIPMLECNNWNLNTYLKKEILSRIQYENEEQRTNHLEQLSAYNDTLLTLLKDGDRGLIAAEIKFLDDKGGRESNDTAESLSNLLHEYLSTSSEKLVETKDDQEDIQNQQNDDQEDIIMNSNTSNNHNRMQTSDDDDDNQNDMDNLTATLPGNKQRKRLRKRKANKVGFIETDDEEDNQAKHNKKPPKRRSKRLEEKR